jgi:hypothetical protein
LPTGLETELSEDTASTLVALELAAIADDEALPESVRREARAILVEVAL